MSRLAEHTRTLTWAIVRRTIATCYPDVPTIDANDLATQLGGAKPPLLLDVRTEAEFAVSHLEGAHRIDPEAEAIPEALEALPRDTPMVAYCSVGVRSAALVQRLRAGGFTEVRNLEGSIFQWANERRPVVRGDAVVRAVHPFDRQWGQLLDAAYRAYT